MFPAELFTPIHALLSSHVICRRQWLARNYYLESDELHSVWVYQNRINGSRMFWKLKDVTPYTHLL